MNKVIIRKTEEIENRRRNINSEINFIPTMGNLHNGHIKLISTAKNDNSNVNLVSIFVNPLQFDNKLDLENYPKTIDNDIKISFANGADAIFIPSTEDIYPPNNKGIKLVERHIKLEELSTADEVFCTGTAAEITPVSKIDDYNFKPDKICRLMIEEYNKVTGQI